MLNEMEASLIKDCCELNENITISIKEEKGKLYVYKSRFLAVNFKRKYLIIDMPSPETHDAPPMKKGTIFEGFFAFKKFRYLIDSRLLDFVKFKMQNREVHAAAISLPKDLRDGDTREYFRVETTMRPPTKLTFNIFPKDTDSAVMSAVVPDVAEEYLGEMVNISGGGFAIRSKPGERPFPLEKGDLINAKFQLKKELPEMLTWAEVRNKRKYKNTEMIIWGLQFIEDERNKNLKNYRNHILRFVVEMQRKMLK